MIGRMTRLRSRTHTGEPANALRLARHMTTIVCLCATALGCVSQRGVGELAFESRDCSVTGWCVVVGTTTDCLCAVGVEGFSAPRVQAAFMLLDTSTCRGQADCLFSADSDLEAVCTAGGICEVIPRAE
jgi:hypothetical protein